MDSAWNTIQSDEWKDESWSERKHDFRWVAHFVLVAVPYLVFNTLMQSLNISVNLWLNHIWGPGNLILIFNTGVSLFQGITSFFLVAEMPVYMRHMHVVRGFSFFLAIIYNVFYLWAGLEYLYGHGEALADGEFYPGLFMLIDMFFLWNISFYFPIFCINMIIIGREFAFEFLKKNRQHFYGGTYDELKLGIGEMWHSYLSVLNLFNPIWWIGQFFRHGKQDINELDEFEDTLTDDQLEYVEDHGRMPKDYDYGTG